MSIGSYPEERNSKTRTRIQRDQLETGTKRGTDPNQQSTCKIWLRSGSLPRTCLPNTCSNVTINSQVGLDPSALFFVHFDHSEGQVWQCRPTSKLAQDVLLTMHKPEKGQSVSLSSSLSWRCETACSFLQRVQRPVPPTHLTQAEQPPSFRFSIVHYGSVQHRLSTGAFYRQTTSR